MVDSFEINYKQDGDVLYGSDLRENLSFALVGLLNYALDGATTTNQDNFYIDLSLDTDYQEIYFMESTGGKWQCIDTSIWDGTVPFIDIYTTSTTGISALAINDCTTKLIKYDGTTYVYRFYATTGTDEERRAKMIKTLFYGTDGSDPKVTGITGLTNLKTSVSRDVGKRGYYVELTASSVGDAQGVALKGTFSDTTNNTDCSSWSYCTATGANPGQLHADWTMPYGGDLPPPPSNKLNSANGTAGGTDTSDETEVDTSADEQDNPTDCGLYIYEDGSTDGGPSGEVRTVMLVKGTLTWSVQEWNTFTNYSYSDTDFYVDHSIPEFEAADIPRDDDCHVISPANTNITASNNLWIGKLKKSISGTSTLTIQVSYDGGSNYTTVTEKILNEISNTGTSGQIKFTISRTDNSTTDYIESYAYYYS